MNTELIKLKLTELMKQISFYEDEHEYYYKGRKCISTTQLINKFKEPFDKKSKAKSSSENPNSKWYGHEPSEILEKWQELKDIACDKGTIIHRYAELYELGLDHLESFPVCYNDWYKQVENFINTELKYHQTMTELILFHPLIYLAGMVDLIKFNNDGTLTLYDYKTNPKINSDNIYNKHFYTPLNIPDTKFDTYSLQLSIYKCILEHHNFKIKEMLLVHITHDKYNLIKCKDYSEEVKKIFKIMKEELLSKINV